MGRILLSICAVVVAVGLGASQQAGQAPQQKQREAAEAQGQRPVPLTTPPGAGAEVEDPGCPDRQDRRHSDLCAQWKAADSARSAANAAWVLGMVGTILGGATLVAAWRAAHWAKKAAEHTETGANAAKEALSDSREAGAAEAERFAAQLAIAKATAEAAKTSANVALNAQRPWIKVHIEGVQIEFYGDPPQATLEAEIAMTNVGGSPAILERLPETFVGVMKRSPMGPQELVGHVKAGVKVPHAGNVIFDKVPIFPNDTFRHPGFAVGAALGDPQTVFSNGKTTIIWKGEPGYYVFVAVSLRYLIPGGEGWTRCFYKIENPDGSPLEPFEGKRSDFLVTRVDGYSHAE